MEYSTLYYFILASAALAISPGPDNIYVLIQSITNGIKSGLATVFGLISGCIIHTTLLAFGVSVLIEQNQIIYTIIKLFGALYLFYLAFNVYKSSSSIDVSGKAKKQSYIGLFKQGVLMNVLNPKVTIFFLSFFPGFLFSQTLNKPLQFYVLGLTFMAVSFIIFSLIALLASKIASVLTRNTSAGLFLKWLQICVFIGIGIYILF